MQKKYSDNPIPNISADWAKDEQDASKRPYSGGAVQTFLKNQLKSKVGFPFLDGDVLNFFADEESMIAYYADPQGSAALLLRSIPLEIGSTQYRVRLTNLLDTRSITIARGMACNIRFKFTSQYKEFGETEWVDNDERGLVDVYARNGVGTYVKVVDGMAVQSFAEITLDVAPYLGLGANTIMVKCTGENTEREATAITYSVTLSSLGLDAQFSWWTPWISGNAYTFNGLYISGNIAKTLHVKITGAGYTQEYEQPLGSTTYTETAYNYQVETFPTPGTGVYHVAMWIETDDGTISTDKSEFNIICVESDDQETAQLCAINNTAAKAVNYATKTLFNYALYNGTASTMPIEITWTGIIDGASVSETFDVVANTQSSMSFAPALEYETQDNTDFSMTASVMNGSATMAQLTFLVDNSAGYSAQAGAVLNISPKNRSNLSSNVLDIINLVDNSVIASTYHDMVWGGADGYTQDENGAQVLRFISGSGLTIQHAPLANWTNGAAKTLEICLAARNVADYTKPIFTCKSADGVGLVIYPDKALLTSRSKQAESTQVINFNDEQKLHFAITLMPNIYGNQGTHLAVIYINGVKNREFSYDNFDSWQSSAVMTFGSTHADVDVYGVREYDVALSSDAIVRNKINWLDNTTQKAAAAARNAIVENSNIELDLVRGKYNYFIVRTEDGSAPPSYTQQSNVYSDLALHFADNPTWDVTLKHVLQRYQGTSSKDYYRWNWRFDGQETTQTTYADGTKATGKSFKLGKEHTEKISKLTAKKNFASSMHSHKPGSVAAFNDLAQAIGLTNEAGARVAIWQYPFVGFLEYVDDNGATQHEFCGLYTIGPDKGNKPTFGYDDEKYPNYVSIEGSDNGPLMTNFRMPWNTTSGRVYYSASDEAIVYNNGTSKTLAWDYDSGAADSGDQEAAQTLLETMWRPAYNFVYECGTNFEAFAGTLAELNAAVATYYNTGKEYWCTADGNLYYYEAAEKKFINASADGSAMHLQTQLNISDAQLSGKTNAEKTAIFKAARVARFKAGASQYFDINDAIFHRNFVEFMAATDNRAKNTYPYRFSLSSKWKWRQDDLDTIFDLTNVGLQDKAYYCEIQDPGVWNGSTSVFWNLIDEAFAQEVEDGMAAFVNAMAELGGTGANAVERCYNFFKKYYWKNAQEYFSETLYNADAKWTYETSFLAPTYNLRSTALSQSLGDHYSAEQAWVAKRIVYMMSKYRCGIFNQENADSITFRYNANELVDYKLTPAIKMYPAVANGDSVARGARTEAGEECTIEVQGTYDQDIKIQGASYLQSVGDLHTLNIGGSVPSISVHAKRLRELILGSKTDADNINVRAEELTLNECKSLRKILLSNVETLSGTLDLEECVLLEEVYADGTGLSVIKLPNGGNVKTIEYGASTTLMMLRNLARLNDDGLDMTACLGKVISMLIEGCSNLTTLSLIYDNYSAEGSSLKYIRAIGIKEEGNDNKLNMLYDFTEGQYYGLNADGTENIYSLPVIEGEIHFVEAMQAYIDFFADKYPNLTLTYDRLVTPSVEQIGLTMDQSDVTAKENAITTPIHSSVSTNNKILAGVNWSATGATIDQNGDINMTLPSHDNDTKSTEIGVTATSKWNAAAKVSRTITIQSVGMSAIVLSSTGAGVPKVGDVVNLAVTISNAAATTKPLSHIGFRVSDETLATIVDNGNGTAVLTIISAEARELVVTAYNKYAATLTDALTWIVNDEIIIDATDETAEGYANARALMDVIYAQNWSASADEMSKGEAGRVTDIAQKFQNNTNIENFDALKYFGISKLAGAFQNCSNLQSVIIKDGLQFDVHGTAMRYGVFRGCTNLTNVVFEGTFGGYLGCSFCDVPLQSIDLTKYTGTAIRSYDVPCLNKLRMTTLNIPSHIVDFGFTFMNNSNLTSVTFEASSIRVRSSEFAGCSKITSMVLPTTTMIYGNSIDKVVGSKISEHGISPKMFQNCTSLKTITLPNGCDYYGDSCFYGCTMLNIDISGKIAYLAGAAFYNVPVCGDIDLSECATLGNYPFYGGKAKITSVKLSNGGTLLKNQTINVQSGHFQQCAYLKKADLNGETIIPTGYWSSAYNKGMFADCPALTFVRMDNVQYIGQYAFAGDSALARIVLPQAAVPTLVNTNAFSSATTIYVPDALLTEYAGASNWSTLYDNGKIKSFTQLKADDQDLAKTYNIMPIVDASASANDAAIMSVVSAQGWSASATEFYADEAAAVTSLGTNTFYGNTSITDMSCLQYFTGVTSIANRCTLFQNCTNLTKVVLPDTITSIDYSASVGGYATTKPFAGCNSLAEINLENVKYISDGGQGNSTNRATFYNCAFTELHLNSAEYIGGAFNSCTKLVSVYLPKVKRLNSDTFIYCSNLENVYNLDNIEYIGARVFMGCNKLAKLRIGASIVPPLGNDTFAGNSVTIIYVKDELLSQYAMATNWSTLYNAGRIKGLSEYTE